MVQDAAGTPLLPSPATISTEDYPLARRLYLYAPPGAPEAARRFVDFALSDEGQAIAEGAGFVDLRPECAPITHACTKCPAEYRAATANACRVSVDFRFDTASRQLDTRALRDLSRLVAALARPEYAGRSLVLIGFSDAWGNHFDNVALSLERARAVEAQLRARGLAIEGTKGLGDAMPVGDNATEEGRERNRRVELWMR
jgi:phosphate transport system substrate-binding protein